MKDDNRRNSNSTTKSNHNSFVHKLYNILEDETLNELIWWASDGISFHIKPIEEFSQTLSKYFKHTNITSFVRQLNIYGFHKINNFIDTSILDNIDYKTTSIENNNGNSSHQKKISNSNNNGVEPIKIWEFRHSTNLFRKGDTESLKFIKRRSPSSKNIYSSTNNNNNPSNSTPNSNKFSQQRHNSNDNALLNDNRFRFVSSRSDATLNHYPLNQQLYPNDTLKNISSARTVSNDYDPSMASPYQHKPSHLSLSSLSNPNQPFKIKQETLIEELKDTNLDMLKLVDLIGSFVSILSDNNNTNNNIPNQYGNLQNDLQILRQNIINRWSRNTDIYQTALPYMNNNTINHASLQQQKLVPIVNKQSAQTIPPPPNNNNTAPTTTTVTGTGMPVTHVVGCYSYPPTPFNQPYMIHNSLPGNIPNYPINQTFNNESGMTMMNPFETKKGSNKRNMSVFIDPLTPVTGTNITGIPTVTRLTPVSNTSNNINSKPITQRGSSVSSVPISSIIDPQRITPDSPLRENFGNNTNSGNIKSNISRNPSPLAKNIISEKSGSGLYDSKEKQTNQCITPQSSVSLGKNENGYVNLIDTTANNTNQTKDNGNSNNNQNLMTYAQSRPVHDYTVKHILNDDTPKNDDLQSDNHVNKKIKTTN